MGHRPVRQAVDDGTELIHIAQPEEVADVIAYLASDHARLVTGNIIHLAKAGRSRESARSRLVGLRQTADTRT